MNRDRLEPFALGRRMIQRRKARGENLKLYSIASQPWVLIYTAENKLLSGVPGFDL